MAPQPDSELSSGSSELVRQLEACRFRGLIHSPFFAFRFGMEKKNDRREVNRCVVIRFGFAGFNESGTEISSLMRENFLQQAGNTFRIYLLNGFTEFLLCNDAMLCVPPESLGYGSLERRPNTPHQAHATPQCEARPDDRANAFDAANTSNNFK
ncbi:hypothetical protein CC78DRAFT_577520 [Lojkania enalia]|uniref:Uncharacterized protein n=1 Tax=Lojkania enalia TaxID=147567 RepID=A0A9P4N7P3_9PLEO|nr:hypothetical protein CC78DRAFT_577520 [Didymosphaeria enalia]